MNVGSTREQAQAALTQFNRQLAVSGSSLHDTAPGDAVGEFAEHLRANRRPSTLKRYLRVLITFFRCFMAREHPDVRRLRDIRPAHVEEYRTRRMAGQVEPEPPSEEQRRREQELRAAVASGRVRAAERGKCGWLGHRPISTRISQRTLNYEIRVLTSFWRWCIRKNWAFVNPATDVEKCRLPKRALPKFMTSEQLRAFFGACNENERRLFMSILLTGMRKGEVEHLEWADISFELGLILIQAKEGWQPKTDERVIPISPILIAILEEQWKNRTSDRLVFATSAGTVDGHILEKLKKICERAGIKPAAATVHALRHSFGAHLRMAGISLADIADLLGHKDLATTQIYARVVQEHLRDAVSKLSPLVQFGRVSQSSVAAHENGRKQLQVATNTGRRPKALSAPEDRS